MKSALLCSFLSVTTYASHSHLNYLAIIIHVDLSTLHLLASSRMFCNWFTYRFLFSPGLRKVRLASSLVHIYGVIAPMLFHSDVRVPFIYIESWA